MPNIKQYNTFAELFYFPDTDYPDKAAICLNTLEEHYPDLVPDFEPFSEFVYQMSLEKLQEIYMRTFDIQALCCMDLGYVLFGEDYTRGKILANLNKELHQHNIDSRCELADRLPNVLRLLAAHKDEEFQEELVSYLIKPALAKMIDEFKPARLQKKEHIYQKFHHTFLEKKDAYINKYLLPLHTLNEMVNRDFPELETVEVGNENDFMDSVKSEFKNQKKKNKF